MSLDTAIKVAKIAVWTWAVAAVVLLALAMILGPELS